jgi:membrane fusion protein, heavy metal efflux system
VQALGGDLVGEIGVLVLRAPLAGRVVAAKVARGQTVDPTVTLFEIADLGSLWVELGVFERDIHVVRVGDKVELTWQGGGEALTGEVAHVGDIVDVATRTAPVRVVVSNEKGLLRPGQSVHARVQTTAPATTALSAPRRGVTRVDGKPTVFVMHDANTVEPRAVVTGPESGSRVAILEGVREGERIVVDGMFALKSEIFR